MEGLIIDRINKLESKLEDIALLVDITHRKLESITVCLENINRVLETVSLTSDQILVKQRVTPSFKTKIARMLRLV